MKRAAYQWGIGRVLYSLDTVWVDIERRGRSYIIKASERKKLDDAYLNALKKLGLEPAAAFRNTAQAMPEEDIYTVLAAKVQGGMSGSNTLINLETPEKKQTYAYVRGVRPELTPGTQLSHVRLTTRKQDTVVFCVLESYEVYQQGQQAA